MKLDHCHRAGCVQIIEQLRTRIAEIEKENVRLKAAVEYAETIRVENIAYFEKQLAASQLREKQLIELIKRAYEFVRDDLCNDGLSSLMEALAITTDTNALDAYVAEKVKEAMK